MLVQTACAPSNLVVLEKQQQNTVQNLYAQMVYDAAASNFLIHIIIFYLSLMMSSPMYHNCPYILMKI